MEIIRHGNPPLKKNSSSDSYIEEYLLKCPDCACEFVASWKENVRLDKGIPSTTFGFGTPYIKFKCPECGKEILFPRMDPQKLYRFQKTK